MEKIIRALGDFPHWLFLIFVASITLIFSIFEIKISVGTFSSKPINPPFFVGLIVSIVLLAVSLAAIYFSSIGVASSGFRYFRLGRAKNCIMFGKVQVVISFGKIQDAVAKELIILPANEFFDDQCINDTRSSLGAYFHSKAPGRSNAISSAVNYHLEQNDQDRGDQVRNYKGDNVYSYKIGTVVPIIGIDGLSDRVALVSATTHRANEGLVAREEYIFAAVRGISRYCGAHRITSIALPLIGSGHGQLTPRVSLISILQALNSISSSSFINSVTIVIFKDGSDVSQIPEWEVNRVLEVAKWLQQRAERAQEAK